MFERAMAIGVKGYVLKDAALSEIVQAVRTIAIGRTYREPRPVRVPGRTFVSVPPRRHRGRGLAAGRVERTRASHPSPDRRIADQQGDRGDAGLNYRTVENQRAAISQKLGLQGSHALVKFAFEHKTEL